MIANADDPCAVGRTMLRDGPLWREPCPRRPGSGIQIVDGKVGKARFLICGFHLDLLRVEIAEFHRRARGEGD